jgi:hypothetical protein
VKVGGERVGGGDDVGSGLDLDCLVAAGCADALPDRPSGARFDPAADGQGGEHERQVGLDRVPQVMVDRPGLEIAFGPPERFLDGLITNGKFCCVRRLCLSLTWWRRPLRLRASVLQTDVALSGDPDDPGVQESLHGPALGSNAGPWAPIATRRARMPDHDPLGMVRLAGVQMRGDLGRLG